MWFQDRLPVGCPKATEYLLVWSWELQIGIIFWTMRTLCSNGFTQVHRSSCCLAEWALLIYISASTNKRKPILTLSNRINISTQHCPIVPACIHCMAKTLLLACVATNASRACSVCKSLCKNYCSVCSEMENDNIVALCGLKSKQGSVCIVKHIYNQWYTLPRKHAYSEVA